MRAIVKFFLSLVIVFGLVWLGLWWYAQGRLQSGFEAWAESQAAAGWKISYTGINRGTSPLQALVRVDNLSLTPPAGPDGQTGTITLPSLDLRIDAGTPLVFHTDLPQRVSLALGGSLDAAMNMGGSSLTGNLDPNALFNKTVYPFRGGDFTASNVDILASEGSLLVLHVDNISSHSDFNRNAGAGSTAFASTITLDGIALSPILTRIASIPFDGKITHLATNIVLSGPWPADIHGLAGQLRAAGTDRVAQQKLVMPVVHQWALAGGTGNASLNLVVGASNANADAAVKFDANLQPTGTANLTADHLDAFFGAITKAYPQLQPDVAQAQAQLSPYLTTTDTGGQSLAMHVTYGPGAININGQKVADQPVVDWNAVENPDVAVPALAPGAPVLAAPPAASGPAN